MDARGVRRSRAAEEEESYFISMADMMVGLLFVFIILLLYFALQFQQKSRALSDATTVRTEILESLRDEIRRANPNLRIEINPTTGVLSLPAEVLFASGQDRLSPEGQQAIRTVGAAMMRVLPCYTIPRRAQDCRYDGERSIDAIFIEGHTDANPITPNGRISDNLDLSAFRATNAFRELRGANPDLLALQNRLRQPILSVSGYGEARPASSTDISLNRRIDLRFLMDTPSPEDLTQMLTGNAQ